jgi:hypothetical protein
LIGGNDKCLSNDLDARPVPWMKPAGGVARLD